MATSALLAERFARQGLATRPAQSIGEATALTSAIQAQDNQASRLGVRARRPSASDADVVAAIETERTVTRTWLLRGTIHLVHTRDLRWLVRLIGPTVERRYRTRWRQLGLGDNLLDATLAVLPDILSAGPLTRHEIAAGLAGHGIALDAAVPQAATHVVLHASTMGLVCRGPDRGRHSTFALMEQWVPEAPIGPRGDDALAELARRYFAAYSPATAADFTTWAGIGAARAVELIRDELAPCDVDGRSGFRHGSVEPEGGVRLLPAFDNYLLGYRDRTAMLPAAGHPLVYRGGIISPTLVIDGRVAGTWSLDRAKRVALVRLMPFDPLTTGQLAAVEGEVADVARFLDRDVELRIAATG